MSELPVLPYRGTAGWSGSDTSHERAEREATDGTVKARQMRVIGLLGEHGSWGLTWHDLAEVCDWHHGQASGALSVLHKEGRIARLTERRQRSLVYVLPEYVNGRNTSPYRPNSHASRADMARAWNEGKAAAWAAKNPYEERTEG